MLAQRISASHGAPADPGCRLSTVHSLLIALSEFAVAGQDFVAPQQLFSALAPQSLEARYAAANPITRRRFDAILREAETSARTGMALLFSRSGRPDRATAAAARFLGRNVTASLGRLDALLPHRLT